MLQAVTTQVFVLTSPPLHRRLTGIKPAQSQPTITTGMVEWAGSTRLAYVTHGQWWGLTVAAWISRSSSTNNHCGAQSSLRRGAPIQVRFRSRFWRRLMPSTVAFSTEGRSSARHPSLLLLSSEPGQTGNLSPWSLTGSFSWSPQCHSLHPWC
jgi:hypothetical protein